MNINRSIVCIVLFGLISPFPLRAQLIKASYSLENPSSYQLLASEDLNAEADRLLGQAKKYKSQGEYDSAKQLFLTLLGPRYKTITSLRMRSILFSYLAGICKELGENREELKYLKAASQLSLEQPDDPFLLTHLWSYGISHLNYWRDKETMSNDDKVKPLSGFVETASEYLTQNSGVEDLDDLRSFAGLVNHGYWNLAIFYNQNRDQKMALASAEKALELIDKYDPENLERRVNVLDVMSLALKSKHRGVVNSGDYERAYLLDSKVYEGMLDLYGDQNPRTLLSLHVLSQSAVKAGHYDLAIKYAKHYYEVTVKTYGISSPQALESLGDLASRYWQAGKQGLSDTTILLLIDQTKNIYGSESDEYKKLLTDNYDQFYGSAKVYIANELVRLESLPMVDSREEIISGGGIDMSVISLLDKLDPQEWTPQQYFSLGRLFLDAYMQIEATTMLRLSSKRSSAALSIWGENSPEYVQSLLNQAHFVSIHSADKASELYRKAESKAVQIYGQNDGLMSELYRELMSYWLRLGNADMFGKYAGEYVRHRLLYYKNVLAYMDSEERLNQMISDQQYFNSIYSEALVVGPSVDLAVFASINRRGLLEQLEKNFNVLQSASASKELVADIRSINQRLSRVDVSAEMRRTLLNKKQTAEKILSEKFSLSYKIISLADLQAKIPNDSILVQYKLIQSGSSQGQYDYVAFLTTSSGSSTHVKIGNAKIIDQLVVSLLQDLRERSPDYILLASKLRSAILVPLASYIVNKNVLLTLDGGLHLAPFALRELRGSNLKSLSILGAPRDLLAGRSRKNELTSSLVISNPDYETGPRIASSRTFSDAESITRSNISNSRTLSRVRWDPLPATQKEGDVLHSILGGEHLSGGEATKDNVVESIDSPLLLHIATHAFYAEEASGDQEGIRPVATDSMLRAGIVLAGANNNADGYLTALELSQLNLHGTELVTLSACDTALGNALGSEGVYGLQRALSVSGAKSALLSLWKVDDNSTSYFMRRFYSLLSEGRGKLEALEMVREEFLSHPIPAWRHPYYWAAFRLNGDTGPVDF